MVTNGNQFLRKYYTTFQRIQEDQVVEIKIRTHYDTLSNISLITVYLI
jgi:hypothetical protein